MSGVLVPFVDLAAEWRPLEAEVHTRIARVFEHGQFVMGPEVAELESRLAESIGVAYATSCASGTTALQIALMALGVGPGDEVIVPAFTFAAPLEVVLLLGARPVLADIDPVDYTIDVDSVRRQISARTKAIIAVSLYGHPADFDRLNQLAAAHGVTVVEDAAQSFGATLNGRRSGGLSTLACTSFFPTKPLGGAGDGGALFTDDSGLACRAREIRDHGQSGKYRHVRLGINGRLDSLACAALLCRLPGLEGAITRRQEIAHRYDLLLGDAVADGLIQLPVVRDTCTSAYAQYTVQLGNRESVIDAMRQGGVQVSVHYSQPLHHQPAFRDEVRHGDLTRSEAAAQRVLCLPIYPGLSVQQQALTASLLLRTLAAQSD